MSSHVSGVASGSATGGCSGKMSVNCCCTNASDVPVVLAVSKNETVSAVWP